MKTGTKVRHKTKGMVETVVGSCKVKVNGVWVDGIVYEGNDVNTGEPMTFVRTKEDFENDFEKPQNDYSLRKLQHDVDLLFSKLKKIISNVI